MTDYNDGEWHHFDGFYPGGVHQESLVSHVWHDERTGKYGMAEDVLAVRVVWSKVLKFRVTKPYQEPRVIWVNEYPNTVLAYQTEDAARRLAVPHATRIAVRYVEAPE